MKKNNDILLELIKKIEELPFDKEVSIAELINYDPQEKSVEPILQGKLFNKLMEVCKQKKINILEKKEEFTGLAYYYEFKKINSNEKSEINLESRKLNRSELINKLNEYRNSNKYDNLDYFKNYISIIESKFQKFYFENDSDFMIK